MSEPLDHDDAQPPAWTDLDLINSIYELRETRETLTSDEWERCGKLIDRLEKLLLERRPKLDTCL